MDEKTCDVRFILTTEDGDIEKVPAHKCILAAISDKYKKQFYGAFEKKDTVHMPNSTAEAFKEFLQFFYRSLVTVTAKNVAQVMSLTKEHMMYDCLIVSASVCKETLASEEMCWGYEIAILLELDELKTFCEWKISANPVETFESSSFLRCNKNVLSRVLQLNSSECNAKVVFEACMEWAKMACIRKELDATMENIRGELGNLFWEIRFKTMTAEDFDEISKTHPDLFTPDEIRTITEDITPAVILPRSIAAEIQPKNGDVLICNRKTNGFIANKFVSPNITIFQSDAALILESFKFDLPTVFTNEAVPKQEKFAAESATITICEIYHEIEYKRLGKFDKKLSIEDQNDILIELPEKIEIDQGAKYSIHIEFEPQTVQDLRVYWLKKSVELDGNIQIKFSSENGIVKCLNFIPNSQ